jgi:hypothetical protein
MDLAPITRSLQKEVEKSSRDLMKGSSHRNVTAAAGELSASLTPKPPRRKLSPSSVGSDGRGRKQDTDDPGHPPSTPRSRPRRLSFSDLLSPKSYHKKPAGSEIGSPQSRRRSGGGAPRASRDRSSSQGRTRRRTRRRGSTGSIIGDQHVQPSSAEDPSERESTSHDRACYRRTDSHDRACYRRSLRSQT